LLNSKEHVECLNEWATTRGITTQHCTFNPFLIKDQLRLISSSNIEPQYRKQSVIVDLIDQKVRGTTRRLANKAQGAGVTVKAYSWETHLEVFHEMYLATMERTNAKEHWKLPFKWFRAFSRLLNPHLLVAEHNGRPESACLIVYSHQYPVAYYHFAASYNRLNTMGINHMMVLAACEFIKSTGIRHLYLGGGVTDHPDDSLLVFKSGFSQHKVPVYSYEIKYDKTGGNGLDKTVRAERAGASE